MSIAVMPKQERMGLPQSSTRKIIKGRVDSGARQACCLEEELYALLKRLTPAARLVVLQRQFAESQRLALERWIIARRQQVSHKVPTAKPCGSRSRTGVSGIETHFRNGKLLYRAGARVGPIRICTGYTQDLAVSCQQLDAVRRICQQVDDAASISFERCFEARLRKALAEEPPGLLLQLRFFATLPGLKTPSFSIASGLEVGLCAWRRLQKACNDYQQKNSRCEEAQETRAEVQRVYTEVWEKGNRSFARRAGAQRKALDKFLSQARSERGTSIQMLFPAPSFKSAAKGNSTESEAITKPGASSVLKHNDRNSAVIFEARVKRRIGTLLKRWLKNEALPWRKKRLCKSRRDRT